MLGERRKKKEATAAARGSWGKRPVLIAITIVIITIDLILATINLLLLVLSFLSINIMHAAHGPRLWSPASIRRGDPTVVTTTTNRNKEEKQTVVNV